MIEFQRLLLGDAIRNDAFFRALQSVIIPGQTTIADIGSGTGFLSFLAEKLGAQQCFLYEESKDLLVLSQNIAKGNGIHRCEFLQTHSTKVQRPPQVDVVISETLGNWPYEENIIETLSDAHRFLKPGGVIIPRELRAFTAPMTSPRLYEELNVWDRIGHDLDVSAAKDVCMNNMYVKGVLPDDLMSEGLLWDTVDFRKKNSSIRERAVNWKVESDITCYGFAIWWEAMLVEDITITTSPFAPSTHWKQIYLPLIDPIPVKKSESIHLTLHSDSCYEVKINVTWETSIADRGGKILKRVQQDIRKGYLS